MAKKILVVLTSADQIGTSGKQTGWYLPELAHPYKVLLDAGLGDIDVISPKGGKSPLDEGSLAAFKDDSVCQWFLADKKAQDLVNNTKTPDQVKASDYSAVVYPGGHGPMFDLATDKTIAKIAAEVYDKGGVVAAVCHGPAALVPIKLSNGQALVNNKNVTAFSNEEEEICQLTALMPFLLESKLVELGGKYTKAADSFKEHVVVDGRLITGQNPASGTRFGEEIAKLLK